MGKIKNILQQDNGYIAAILSILVPITAFYLLDYIVILLTRYVWYQLQFVNRDILQLVAIFLNLFIFRKYITGKDYPRNGKVVLAITFTLALLHFSIVWL